MHLDVTCVDVVHLIQATNTSMSISVKDAIDTLQSIAALGVKGLDVSLSSEYVKAYTRLFEEEKLARSITDTMRGARSFVAHMQDLKLSEVTDDVAVSVKALLQGVDPLVNRHDAIKSKSGSGGSKSGSRRHRSRNSRGSRSSSKSKGKRREFGRKSTHGASRRKSSSALKKRIDVAVTTSLGP